MLKITVFAVFITFGLFFTGCEVSPDATFRVNYYSYDNTSGFRPVDPTLYKYNETAIVLDRGSLLKEGYTFKNWNTDRFGDGISYEVGDEIIIRGPVVLFTMWTKNPET